VALLTRDIPPPICSKILAHPLDPAPGRVMVVRACVTLDNLDQVGELGFGQRVLLNQPSLEFEPDQSQPAIFVLSAF